MIKDLLLIACIVTFGIDCTDIMDSVKGALGRWINRKPENITLKPFDCSLCSTWWACLLYCIITHHFNLEGIALSALMAHCAKPLGQLLNWMKYALETAVHLFVALLDKIWEKV